MKTLILAAGFGLTIVAAAPALANAEPDDFASGTDISNAYAGVSLLTVFTGADVEVPTATAAVLSLTDPLATTGSRVFGHSQTNTLWGNGNFEYLLATFTTPVFSVSLDFFANDPSDSNPQLLAFDEMGAQIDIDSAGFVALGSPVTLTVTGTGIKFVRAYWDEINRNDNGGLDNLVFNAVPEPATWAMMIAGFGLAGCAMRRRTIRTSLA